MRPYTLLATILSLALVGGCGSEHEWNGTNVADKLPRLAFELISERGNTITGESYRGRIGMLLFGDIADEDGCTNTLARLSSAVRKLDAAARHMVRVLFVSVDPRRDTPERLAAYTASFGDHFIGATGEASSLRALAQRYNTTLSYGESAEHCKSVFVFDMEGHARLRIRADASASAITQDLRALLP